MPKKIMVVDDHPYTCMAIKHILEGEGFDVVTAQDGTECLRKLKTNTPDLIIIDFFMPGMSGLELCEEIRKIYDSRLRSLNVIFLTVARPKEIGEERLHRVNVLDYITKPFDNEDLVRRVEQIVGK